MSFEGKIAIVTGSSMGIGKATAKILAERRAVVITNSRTLARAEKTAEEIRSMGGKAMAIEADVTNRKEVEEMVKKVIDTYGRIDILINNAGKSIGLRYPKLEEVEYEDWDRNIDLNLTGTFNMCRAVVPHMRRRKYGKIVNVGSGAGRVWSRSGIHAYAAAKAGLMGFTRQLALEAGPDGINVNCAAPGLILTHPERGFPYEKEVGRERVLSDIPLRRLGEPEEMAKAIVFLASDDASYITGQTLGVDGGHWMI